MPAHLSIHPRFGLMYVAFSGHVHAHEAVSAFQKYIAHPDYAPGQKHLINFSDVTGFEGDHTNLMKLQAGLVDAVMPSQQVLFVYCAPTELAQGLVQLSMNAWKDVPKVILRVLKTEADAMDVIGLPNMTFAELARTTA